MDDKDLLEEESSLEESSNLINNAGNAFFNHSSEMIKDFNNRIQPKKTTTEEIQNNKHQLGLDDNRDAKAKLNNSRKNNQANNSIDSNKVNNVNNASLNGENGSDTTLSKKKKHSSIDGSNEGSLNDKKKVDLKRKEEQALKTSKLNPKNKAEKEGKKAAANAIIQFITKNPYVLIGVIIVIIALIIIFLLFISTTSGFVALKEPGVLCNINKPIENGTISSQFSWRVFNGIAEPHKGIDIKADEGTEVKAVMDGTIIDMGYDDINGSYIIIEHEEYNLRKYKTFYASLLDSEQIIENELEELELEIGDSVDKGDVIGYVGDTNYEGGEHLHFEILADNEQISPNRLYGYDNPYGSCHPVYAENTTIDQIQELECEQLVEDPAGLSSFCVDSLEGTYTSLVCGTENIDVVEPVKAQCAAGVHSYFKSFLPELDPDAWAKFERIRGNARDYWERNSALGTEGFKTSKEPSAGSIWTCNYSRAEDANGVPYGHVMVVLSVDGENVNVFECNGDGKETCWHKTYTKKSLSSRRGFTGYIQILGDC